MLKHKMRNPESALKQLAKMINQNQEIEQKSNILTK